jgi:hypothetical protein
MTHDSANFVQRDRVLPITRWLATFLLPFLAVAFALLFVWPDHTDRLFAWTIRPDLTAMMLAAAYLGGLVFFGQVVRAARWTHIKNGFPAVFTFATLLGIATALHWNRFHPGHISFIAWAGLYFSTPVLILWVWLVNERTARGSAPQPADLPLRWRLIFLVIGLTTLSVAVALWTLPTLVIPRWPWALTPLTAKVVGALFTLPGMVGLSVARDGHWAAARTLVQAQLLSIATILVALVRDWSALDGSPFVAWGFAGGLVLNFWLYTALLLTFKLRAGWRVSFHRARG